MQGLQIMSYSSAQPAVLASSAVSRKPRSQVSAGVWTASALSGRSSYMGNRLRTRSTLLSPGDRQCNSGSTRRRCNSVVTRASFLGVGAPEAILVGVVALVIFGPKGLAEAAKGVGKTLRAFAPTLQELTSVSRDLKNTLDNELGIDEIRRDFASAQSTAFAPTKPKQQDSSPDPVSPSAPSAASTEAGADQSLQAITDDIAQSMDADIERKREQAAQAAWGGQAPSASDGAASPDLNGSNGSGGNTEAAGEGGGSSVDSGGRKSALDELSLDDLQAELERRKQFSSKKTEA